VIPENDMIFHFLMKSNDIKIDRDFAASKLVENKIIPKI